MTVPEPDRDLNREEAFCLRIVLAKERVKREQLSTIIDTLDRVLRAPLARRPRHGRTILCGTGTGGSAGRRDGDRTGADTVTVLQGLVEHRDRPGDAHENGRRTRSRVPGRLGRRVPAHGGRRAPSPPTDQHQDYYSDRAGSHLRNRGVSGLGTVAPTIGRTVARSVGTVRGGSGVRPEGPLRGDNRWAGARDRASPTRSATRSPSTTTTAR